MTELNFIIFNLGFLTVFLRFLNIFSTFFLNFLIYFRKFFRLILRFLQLSNKFLRFFFTILFFFQIFFEFYNFSLIIYSYVTIFFNVFWNLTHILQEIDYDVTNLKFLPIFPQFLISIPKLFLYCFIFFPPPWAGNPRVAARPKGPIVPHCFIFF